MVNIKIVKSELADKDGGSIDIEIAINEITEDTSTIDIGNKSWSLDTDNLKNICKETLKLIKEKTEKN